MARRPPRRRGLACAIAFTANAGTPAVDGALEHGFEALLVALTGTDLRRCPACRALTLVRRPLPDLRSRAPPVAA